MSVRIEKEVWIDLNGKKVNILKDWLTNPLTTTQRIALGTTLNADHAGLPVYDKDLLKLFYWNGSTWDDVSGGGGGGTSATVDLVAGETISSGIVVIIFTDGKVYKYDITDETNAGLTCGIAKTSGTVGNPITITLPGNIHIEVGSGWQPGLVYYINSSSLLSITPPTTGIVKEIATGINTDTVLISNYNELIII